MATYKVIGIIGTRRRDANSDFKLVEKKFLEIYKEGDWICSGKCGKGGDRFAILLKDKYCVPYLEFPANWKKHGNNAGHIRNTPIANHSDILIACVAIDRTGGTEDTIRKFNQKVTIGEVHLI